MPQVEVEPSVSDRLGSLADKPIDLGDDVYFRFFKFWFLPPKNRFRNSPHLTGW